VLCGHRRRRRRHAVTQPASPRGRDARRVRRCRAWTRPDPRPRFVADVFSMIECAEASQPDHARSYRRRDPDSYRRSFVKAVFIALPLYRPSIGRSSRSTSLGGARFAGRGVVALVEHRQFSKLTRGAPGEPGHQRPTGVDRDHVLWNNGTFDELYAQLDGQLLRCGLIDG